MNVLLNSNVLPYDLKSFCSALNEKCIELQNAEKEHVPELTAVEAYSLIKNIKLNDAGDVLLYCAAMNLLNTYVKQKDSTIGYNFKNELHYLTSILLNVDINDVYIDYQAEAGSVLMIKIYDIQFSFHDVRRRLEIIKLCKSEHYLKMEWDGVRKQQCAATLYDMAKTNTFRVDNMTYRGKDLWKKVFRQVEQYKLGNLTIKQLGSTL